MNKSLATVENSPLETESPKTKQNFLKRGEGKLCTKIRSASQLKQKKVDLARLRGSDSVMMENSREDSFESEYRHEPQKSLPNTDKNYEKYKKLLKNFEEKKSKLEKDALEFYKLRESEVKSFEL